MCQTESPHVWQKHFLIITLSSWRRFVFLQSHNQHHVKKCEYRLLGRRSFGSHPKTASIRPNTRTSILILFDCVCLLLSMSVPTPYFHYSLFKVLKMFHFDHLLFPPPLCERKNPRHDTEGERESMMRDKEREGGKKKKKKKEQKKLYGK